MAGESRATEGGAIQTRYFHHPCPMGSDSNLQLDPAQPTGTPDPTADALAQRHRSLEHDAQNRLAALFATGEVMTKLTSPTAVFRRELLDR